MRNSGLIVSGNEKAERLAKISQRLNTISGVSSSRFNSE